MTMNKPMPGGATYLTQQLLTQQQSMKIVNETLDMINFKE